MTTLVWTKPFIRKLKRKLKRAPSLQADVEQTLRQLAQNPFAASLESHKLKGQLAGVWACRLTYDLRILFEFVENPKTGEQEIHLLTVGSHDEVY